MKSAAILLWLVYAVTGLPLTAMGSSFTGGGLPSLTVLDDWSNPILVLIWALGAFVVFVLPALAFTTSIVAVLEWLRDRRQTDAP